MTRFTVVLVLWGTIVSSRPSADVANAGERRRQPAFGLSVPLPDVLLQPCNCDNHPCMATGRNAVRIAITARFIVMPNTSGIPRRINDHDLLRRDPLLAARTFMELWYQTKDSWSRSRRVIGKAEYLEKGENPRFVVTSLSAQEYGGCVLYDKEYCARGEDGEPDQGTAFGFIC